MSLPHGEAHLRRIFRHYTRKARLRNIEFNLSEKEFRAIIIKRCFYCTAKPEKISYDKGMGSINGLVKTNGVDRFNNDQGYTRENAIACCYICNRMKNNLSVKDYLSKIKAVYKNLDLETKDY